jgi:hypothetical protein
MKKKIVFILFAFLFLQCRRNKETERLLQVTTDTQSFNTCLKSKKMPVFPKQDTYVEGEINGNYFVLSNHKEANVSCSLGSFRGNGYKPEYKTSLGAIGHGFYVYPIRDSTEYQYFLTVDLPAFMGDSTAYEKYFEQFQKGKVFNFVEFPKVFEDAFKPETVRMFFTFDGCENIGLISSELVDQTGSYFRVSNVKEIKDGQGKVVDREVTIEFDVQLGKGDIPVGRIKNGKLVFWY